MARVKSIASFVALAFVSIAYPAGAQQSVSFELRGVLPVKCGISSLERIRSGDEDLVRIRQSCNAPHELVLSASGRSVHDAGLIARHENADQRFESGTVRLLGNALGEQVVDVRVRSENPVVDLSEYTFEVFLIAG